jgi:hypothetical protein
MLFRGFLKKKTGRWHGIRAARFSVVGNELWNLEVNESEVKE